MKLLEQIQTPLKEVKISDYNLFWDKWAVYRRPGETFYQDRLLCWPVPSDEVAEQLAKTFLSVYFPQPYWIHYSGMGKVEGVISFWLGLDRNSAYRELQAKKNLLNYNFRAILRGAVDG